MTTELDQRIQAGLKEFADAVHVPARPAITAVHASPRKRWQPAVAAAAVLLLLGLLPWVAPGRPDVGSADIEQRARIPAKLAPFSLLTADVASASLSRVSMVYLQRNNAFEDYFQQWQTVLLDADGIRYRQTAIAGSPPASAFTVYRDVVRARPWLLSPDGRRLAFSRSGKMQVIEVATGALRQFTLPLDVPARPLAWSFDGEKLALVSLAGSESGAGALSILDLRSGSIDRVAGADGVSEAAWSQDGTVLAYQSGRRILMMSHNGRAIGERQLPEGYHLAGQIAWSPDAQLLAVICAEEQAPGILQTKWLGFLDLHKDDGTIPAPAIPLLYGEVLQGWRYDRTVVLWNHAELLQTNIDGYGPTVLATTGAETIDLQLAAGLLRDFEVAADSPVDRGPWPGWARGIVAAAITATALAVLLIVLVRRRIRHERSPATPDGAAQ